jgi:hypothetical protein
MSFEFDPNLNIDRAEDGNDPQNIESIVGGEGEFPCPLRGKSRPKPVVG